MYLPALLRVTVTDVVLPALTIFPSLSTPWPLTPIPCFSPEDFGLTMTIVTLPLAALRLFLLNLNWPLALAVRCSVVPPLADDPLTAIVSMAAARATTATMPIILLRPIRAPFSEIHSSEGQDTGRARQFPSLRAMVIAIDGPAGAGKSTVARALAARLGFTYLDSGAMYRSVALASRERTAPPATLAPFLHIEVGERVLLDGEDVTEAIRTPEVSEAASAAAADPRVREAMVAKQRALMATGDWVAEGRDIGTVVAPDAALKVFLTASPEERARRRARELGADPEAVLAEQAARDERDRTREHSPLIAAPAAVEVDTTGLTLEQVVDRIAALAETVRAS